MQYSFIQLSVTSAGNSQTILNYSFTDNTPLNGNNYYRLKQVDLDQRFTYSAVVQISNKETASIFNLSPNPAKNFINIIYTGKAETLAINVYDAQGKLVKQQTQRNAAPIKVEIKQLKAGIYTIQFFDGSTVSNTRFLKQ